MPQIKVYFNPMASNALNNLPLNELDRWLTEALESAFEISGKNDVAFDVFDVRYTARESPVQIEVLYTAGSDEYGTGSVFDPDDTMKTRAINQLKLHFRLFLKVNGADNIVPSVWIRPQYNSKFEPGVAEDK